MLGKVRIVRKATSTVAVPTQQQQALLGTVSEAVDEDDYMPAVSWWPDQETFMDIDITCFQDSFMIADWDQWVQSMDSFYA